MAIRYASTTGSALNDGVTEGNAWTLLHGWTQLVAGMDLVILDGTYTANWLVNAKSGTAGSYITVRAQNKWGAVLTGSTSNGLNLFQCHYLVIDGLKITDADTNGVAIGGTLGGSFITLRNCWISNSTAQGIEASTPANANITVENCLVELSGNGVYNGDPFVGHGMYLAGPNHIVRNNVFRNNAGHGFTFYSSTATYMNNLLCYNNLVFGSIFYAASFYSAVADNPGKGTQPGTNHVFCNTFAGGVQTAFGTLYFRNNIVTLPPDFPAPYIESTTPILQITANPATLINDYNLSTVAFTAASVTAGANDVVSATANFVNTADGLYWLADTSPAIGEALSSVFGPVNFFGNGQTAVADIGAFQFAQNYADDVRDLSDVADPDYWEVLAPEPPTPAARVIFSASIDYT